MTTSIVIDANTFVSRWFIRPERRDEFIRLFNQLWQADVEGLKQATYFVFYGWGRDANEFVAIESWKNEAAVAEHPVHLGVEHHRVLAREPLRFLAEVRRRADVRGQVAELARQVHATPDCRA